MVRLFLLLVLLPLSLLSAHRAGGVLFSINDTFATGLNAEYSPQLHKSVKSTFRLPLLVVMPDKGGEQFILPGIKTNEQNTEFSHLQQPEYSGLYVKDLYFHHGPTRTEAGIISENPARRGQGMVFWGDASFDPRFNVSGSRLAMGTDKGGYTSNAITDFSLHHLWYNFAPFNESPVYFLREMKLTPHIYTRSDANNLNESFHGAFELHTGGFRQPAFAAGIQMSAEVHRYVKPVETDSYRARAGLWLEAIFLTTEVGAIMQSENHVKGPGGGYLFFGRDAHTGEKDLLPGAYVNIYPVLEPWFRLEGEYYQSEKASGSFRALLTLRERILTVDAGFARENYISGEDFINHHNTDSFMLLRFKLSLADSLVEVQYEGFFSTFRNDTETIQRFFTAWVF